LEANQIGPLLPGRYGVNPLGRYVGLVDGLAVDFRPGPAAKCRPSTGTTHIPCRSVPLRTAQNAAGTTGTVYTRAAPDRKNTGESTGTVYTRAAPCRCGPPKMQPEQPKLCTHVVRRGYTTGTCQNTGLSHGMLTQYLWQLRVRGMNLEITSQGRTAADLS
jgi:hypothetical protein